MNSLKPTKRRGLALHQQLRGGELLLDIFWAGVLCGFMCTSDIAFLVQQTTGRIGDRVRIAQCAELEENNNKQQCACA